MTDKIYDHFTRRIGCERILLMLPLHVIMVGRVRGNIDPEQVKTAMEKLRNRHPLLGVRAKINEDGNCWYTTENVPPMKTHVEKRNDDRQWHARVMEELRTSFPIETGPLVRCAVIHSPNVSEIVLCGHHAICDGMSLGYLLRDLMQLLSASEAASVSRILPPPIDATTVPNSPKPKLFVRFIMNLINKKWAKKHIRFSESEMSQMHDAYWKRNNSVKVVAWELGSDVTELIVKRCRDEKVTVNSALWTAFIASQYEIQGGSELYRQRSALAVNNRGKLDVPVEDAFGFYASSLTVKLKYSPEKGFWDNARTIHSRIAKELATTDLFRMLSGEMLHPTLLDSIYFQKYGFIDERLSKKLLKKMGWHKTTYGYALTNVGRLDIPTNYGPYTLESVYGPLFYSDVEEKMVCVITIGGRMSFMMAVNETVAGDSGRIRDSAMSRLTLAIDQ